MQFFSIAPKSHKFVCMYNISDTNANELYIWIKNIFISNILQSEFFSILLAGPVSYIYRSRKIYKYCNNNNDIIIWNYILFPLSFDFYCKEKKLTSIKIYKITK